MLQTGPETGKVHVAAVMDVDQFKSVNDTYGHDGGDAVLKTLAREVENCIRGTDIFARYGGDEFVFFISIDSLPEAEEYFCRILKRISALKITYEEQTLSITVSIGIAEARSSGENVDMLMKRADRGLYQAKKDGRNCCRTG
jgi:diguanylate cyclase (GGDEF)-like protein